MALVKQPKTDGLRPISRYDIFVDRPSISMSNAQVFIVLPTALRFLMKEDVSRSISKTCLQYLIFTSFYTFYTTS